MVLDREVINLRLARIESCLGQLEPFSAMSELSFLARYDRYHEAKQILAAALNAVDQVSRHLQRAMGKRNDNPLGQNEKICYLGKGSFGIVQFRPHSGHSNIFIRKRIQYEDPEPVPEWRRKQGN